MSAAFLSKLVVATCALAVWAGAAPAGAQPLSAPEYPSRTMRIVVTTSPGTADDLFARALGIELHNLYGYKIVVENRTGAGGLIGNAVVSRAPADGHTLGMVGVTRLITALMHESPPYQALADVAGVAHVASITNVLAVSPRLPTATAIDFVAYARPRPDELNYASLGPGSASHLAGELFSRATGIQAIHVAFRNLQDSFVEMSLGRVHYAVYTLPAALQAVRNRRVRALAVMTPQRSPALPHVPSVAELGLPEAQFDSWAGIVVPAATPRRVVEQLHGDIVRKLRMQRMRELFASQGAETAPDNTPDGFSRLMQSEYLRYEAIIRRESLERS